MDAKGVLEFAAKNNTKILDLRFTDLPGVWQHVSFPIQELSENSFKEGFGFDASSIRGWASIHESDMLLMPDPSTAFMDPFRDAPTLVMIGDAYDPPPSGRTRATPATSPRKRKPISPPPASPTRHSSAPRRSSSSSTTSASTARPSTASTSLTPRKAAGTPAARRTTSVFARA